MLGRDAQHLQRLTAFGAKVLLQRIVSGIELINDIDRLGRDAQVRHEQVKLDHLPLVRGRSGDQQIELHPEQDFLLHGQTAPQLLGPLIQILGSLQSFEIAATQVGINGFRIVVAQVAETGVDFRFIDHAIEFAEPGKNLDQHWKHLIAPCRKVRSNRPRPLQCRPPSRRLLQQLQWRQGPAHTTPPATQTGRHHRGFFGLRTVSRNHGFGQTSGQHQSLPAPDHGRNRALWQMNSQPVEGVMSTISESTHSWPQICNSGQWTEPP